VSNSNSKKSNVWGYLLMTIILIYSSYAEYSKKTINNDLILNGNVLKAIVIERPETCSEGYRLHNYCKIKTEKEGIYELKINYNTCMTMSLGDTLLVRQKNDVDKVLRFNSDAKPSKYYIELLILTSGLASFLAFIYNLTLVLRFRKIK
jgi:hypothetical protein